MEKLFENPGRKLKALALLEFLLIAFACVAYGIYLMIKGNEYAVIGFFSIPVGILLAYISALFLYALGELIDKMTQTEENTREICRTGLLERRDRLDKECDDEYDCQDTMEEYTEDDVIAREIEIEEGRVEAKAVLIENIAIRLATLKELLSQGRITEKEYLNELKRL